MSNERSHHRYSRRSLMSVASRGRARKLFPTVFEARHFAKHSFVSHDMSKASHSIVGGPGMVIGVPFSPLCSSMFVTMKPSAAGGHSLTNNLSYISNKTVKPVKPVESTTVRINNCWAYPLLRFRKPADRGWWLILIADLY